MQMRGKKGERRAGEGEAAEACGRRAVRVRFCLIHTSRRTFEYRCGGDGRVGKFLDEFIFKI